ncbi:MAG: carboxypeptidase-like regulatory domain-containing protein [Bacteroidetes bacterium]|jgi:hypothetical protein|nr:carboxypeptidase-like regulatory domain-containing protein [Bacteroidota bacterium]
MTLIKSIAIEKPCGQSWQQMTEESNGRYCAHCCKTVVDFTRMTDTEVIEYLSTRNHVCGRFDIQQLNKLNQNLSYNKSGFLNWKGWGLAAMILGFSQYVNADTRQPFKVEQAPYQNNYKPVTDSSIIVKGKIIAQDNGLPIPGATVVIKGTNEGAVTDINGEFKIEIHSASDTLVARFIGYKSQEIKVSQLKTLNSNITLYADTTSLITAAAGGLIVRRPFYARAWYKLKYAVRSIFH